MQSAVKAGKLDPLEVFNLTEQQYTLLSYVYDRPRKTAGFDIVDVDYLQRAALITASHRGRLLTISSAGKAFVDVIRIMRCT